MNGTPTFLLFSLLVSVMYYQTVTQKEFENRLNNTELILSLHEDRVSLIIELHKKKKMTKSGKILAVHRQNELFVREIKELFGHTDSYERYD